MATSAIDVANSVLFMLGEQEISSFEDADSDPAAVFARVYEPFKQARLEEYPWRWATRKQQFSRDAAAPSNEWQYRYLVPTETIRILAIYNSASVGARPFREFDRQGDYILTDADVIYGDVMQDKSEADWPRIFEQYVANALAAEVAIAITGKISMAEHFWQKAYGLPQERGEGGLYARAKAWDNAQTPPQQVQDFTLIDSRFGTGLTADVRLR